MTPEERDRINLQTFLAPEKTEVAGFTLRPLTLGSFCLLKEGHNEFITPRGADGTIDNELLAVLEYVYLHAAPLPEVQTLILDMTQLRPKAIGFGMDQPLTEIPTLVSEIRRSLEAVNAANFEVVDKPGSSTKPEPGAPPKS